MSGTTSRLGITTPALEDAPNIETVATAFEALTGIAAAFATGPDAEKGSPGTAGRLHWADDTRRLYWDTGQAWRLVDARGAAGGALSGSYPNPSIAAGAVGASNLAAGAVGAAAIAAAAVAHAHLALTLLQSIQVAVYSIGGGDVAQITPGGWRELGEIAGTSNDLRLPPLANHTIQTRLVAMLRTANANGGLVATGVRTPDGLVAADTGTIAGSNTWRLVDSGWVNANAQVYGFFQARNDSAGGAWDVWIQHVAVFQRYTR